MSCQSSEVRIEGLETLDYLDNLSHKERFTEQGDAITFESEVKIFPQYFKGCIDDVKLFKSAQTSGNLSLASKLLQFPWYSQSYNCASLYVCWKHNCRRFCLRCSRFLLFCSIAIQVDRVYVSSPNVVAVLDHEKKHSFVIRKEGLPDIGKTCCP